VADPANRAIASWQIYDTAATDSLLLNGAVYSAHSATNAITVSSLTAVSLSAGVSPCTDTIEVRAYNGLYWGDWQPLNVTVTAAPPVLAVQTPKQTWAGGKTFSLTLSAGTFTDPQHQTLSYAATLLSGQALPNWLSFNADTQTFSGTAPSTAQNLTIKVTATDISGLTASETIAANVSAPIVKPGITVTAPTAAQTWVDGQTVDLVLARNTFTDTQNLKMSFAAYEASGPNITSWLHFNAATHEFTGKIPTNASGTVWLAVVASDAQKMSAVDLFPVTFVSGVGQAAHAGSAGPAPSIDPSHLQNLLVFHS